MVEKRVRSEIDLTVVDWLGKLAADSKSGTKTPSGMVEAAVTLTRVTMERRTRTPSNFQTECPKAYLQSR